VNHHFERQTACSFCSLVIVLAVPEDAIFLSFLSQQAPEYEYEYAPDTRAGGGAPVMESRLSTLATCEFGVRTSLEATNRLSCPCSADTALKPYLPTYPSRLLVC